MLYSNYQSISKLSILLVFFNSFLINAQLNDSLATINLKKGKDQLFYGKYNESINLFQDCLDHYKATDDLNRITSTFNLLSKAYHSNSRVREAMSYGELALKSSRQKGFENKLEEANALDNIGVARSFMRRLEEAQENHELALKIRLEHFKEDHYNLASTYFNLGLVYQRKGDFKNALKYLDKVLDMSLEDTPENKILVANTNEVIGFLNYDKSDFNTALEFFEKTFNLAKEVYEKDNPYFIKVYNDLGLIYSIKEYYNESLKYYQKALSVSITNYGMDGHPDQMKVHYNIGTVYRIQNQKEKAIYHTQKSLDMGLRVLGENHENLFFTYSQFGQIYGSEEGIAYIMKALDVTKNPVRISYLYGYLSVIYTNIGDHKKALEFAKKALSLRLKLFKEKNISIVRSNITVSKAYLNLNDYDNALLYNHQAMNYNYLGNENHNILAEKFKSTNYLDDDLLLESIKVEADIKFAMFNTNGNVSDLKESNSFYLKAHSLVNSVRNKRRDYEDKIRLSELVKSVYAKIIETSLLLNKKKENETLIKDLFYYSEKSRANILRELAKNSDLKKILNIDSSILDLEQSINFNISKLTTDLISEITQSKIDTSRVYEIEGDILDATIRKDSLEKRIEADFPKYYSLKYEKSIIKIEEIQERLDGNTTLLEFFQSNEVIYAFVITKNSYNIQELSVPELDEKIRTFNKTITSKNQSNFLDMSYNLYQLLIKPIEKHFVGHKLIVLPDEALWHLQFDLLVNSKSSKTKNHYLLYDYAISYANSASMLFESTHPQSNHDLLDQCIAFSYTSKGSTSTNNNIDLPGSRKEVEELSAIFKGNYFYDDSANETTFKSTVSDYKLVHLALHADIDSLNPKLLKIQFSDKEQNEKEDNILYGHELYGLNIPADLVVLSACNTGIGKVNKGEGILSLGNAFQYAGAESLLLSRWEISDDATPEVMRLFYTNIKKGMNKSKALQQAKITFLNSSDAFTSKPFYWGSFYILGTTDPIELNSTGSNIYYYLGILLFLLIVIYFYRRLKS